MPRCLIEPPLLQFVVRGVVFVAAHAEVSPCSNAAGQRVDLDMLRSSQSSVILRTDAVRPFTAPAPDVDAIAGTRIKKGEKNVLITCGIGLSPPLAAKKASQSFFRFGVLMKCSAVVAVRQRAVEVENYSHAMRSFLCSLRMLP